MIDTPIEMERRNETKCIQFIGNPLNEMEWNVFAYKFSVHKITTVHIHSITHRKNDCLTAKCYQIYILSYVNLITCEMVV